jgi:hypothetical protein
MYNYVESLVRHIEVLREDKDVFFYGVKDG